MANDLSLSLRIPSMLMARLEELREHLEADPDLAYLGEDLSRSMLVRLALQKGVEALEEMYDVTPSSVTTRVTTRTSGSGVYRTSTRKISDRTRRHRAPTEPLPRHELEEEGDGMGVDEDRAPAEVEMADARSE